MSNHIVLWENKNFRFVISTRIGGFSEGNYFSLNLGLTTEDVRETVLKNRELFFNTVLPDNKSLVYASQIHSDEIKKVDFPGLYEQTDGFFSDSKNLVVSITVADCFPVFLGHPKSGYFALLHMGWRGTVAGILPRALDHFAQMGISSQTLDFAIGPGIGVEHFEIGADVKHYFPDRYFKPGNSSKGFLNLGAFIMDQFIEYGGKPENIHDKSECTYENKDKYFSYRRDGKKSGRMLALAWRKI